MKYLEYSYLLDAPIESAFSNIIDIKKLHENTNIFGQGDLVTDTCKPEDIGKEYTVSIRTEACIVRTTLKVEKIEIPHRIHYSYRYQMVDYTGRELKHTIFPWETMDCFIHFSIRNGKTKVKTIMVANGVRSLSQKIKTRALSLVNWLQQRSINHRVKTYIEKNA